jgi:predicted metal-dependent peptidase
MILFRQKKEFEERYDRVVDKLYDVNYYLASEICKLGYPELTDKIPTAGVAWNDEKKKIRYLFNENFVKNMTDDELSFVITHEVNHVVRCHPILFNDFANRLKEIDKPADEIRKKIRKMNIAADCVVNDYLVNSCKMEKVEKIEKAKLVYGEDIVGRNCEDMTAQEVFRLIPDEKVPNDVCVDHFWESFCDESGNLKKDFVDRLSDIVSENTGNSILTGKELSQVEGIRDSLENSDDSYAHQRGVGAVGRVRPIGGLGRNSVNWAWLLTKFTETKKVLDIWNRHPRNMMSVYPDVILPSVLQEEKEEIFLAIDTSQSIDHQACSLFVDVARNSPKRFKIKAITFDYHAYEFDIHKDEPKGGGGTSFIAIEKYIQKKLKKYPKMVVVLTDGKGDLVKPQHPDRWCWLLYGHKPSTRCIGSMKRFFLEDLLK